MEPILAIAPLAILLGGTALGGIGYGAGYATRASGPVNDAVDTFTSFTTIAKIGIVVVVAAVAYYFVIRKK